jgi:hypothetical protein
MPQVCKGCPDELHIGSSRHHKTVELVANFARKQEKIQNWYIVVFTFCVAFIRMQDVERFARYACHVDFGTATSASS